MKLFLRNVVLYSARRSEGFGLESSFFQFRASTLFSSVALSSLLTIGRSSHVKSFVAPACRRELGHKKSILLSNPDFSYGLSWGSGDTVGSSIPQGLQVCSRQTGATGKQVQQGKIENHSPRGIYINGESLAIIGKALEGTVHPSTLLSFTLNLFLQCIQCKKETVGLR